MPDTKMKISKNFSFELWNLWTYLKGRKRTVITAVSGLLLYWLTDEALAAIVGGVIVEGVISVIEYFFEKVEVPQ